MIRMEVATSSHNSNFPVSKNIGTIGMNVAFLFLYFVSIYRPLVWIIGELDISTAVLFSILAGIGLLASIWRFGRFQNALPYSVIALILLCVFASIVSFPILQQLGASFALLGLYGFFAGFERFSIQTWRAGLIMAALAALALPFALVPGTGMGFYLRLITADAAAQLLSLMGHKSLGAHDVLIFDNGIAQVDLPCSGLKSLFTGTGFFLIASLILRRAVSFKWMIGYAVFAGLLIIANTLRVTTLIWVSEILERRGMAEAIHMPLGLMLFCLVCLSGIFILLKIPSYKARPNQDKSTSELSRFNHFGLYAVACLLLILAIATTPHALTSVNTQIVAPNLPTITRVELTPTETDFFEARERTSAGKWMFKYNGLSGSMLVVRSGAANGLHAPEVCLLGNGISVEHMESRPWDSGSYRWLTVDQKRRNAVYWMQSQSEVTDDFRKRFGKYVLNGQNDWVMVTLLFDKRLNLNANSDETETLMKLMTNLKTHYAGQIEREEKNNVDS